jgi:high-affinity K+ transport system ATPase subunit B
MKKVTALSLSISAYFVSAMPARAQWGGNICPADVTSADGNEVINFNPLCYLYGASGNLVGNLINIALIVTVIIALAFLIYGGIKWITSGGDKAGVESARNMIVAALVGLVIAFLAYFIIQLVFTLFGINFAGGNFLASFTLFN